MKAFITKMAYKIVNNDLQLQLWGRNADGTRCSKLVTGTEPYFGVPYDPHERYQYLDTETRKMIRRIEKHGDIWKIYAMYPFHVQTIRDKFPGHLEADVTYDLRQKIDLGIKGVVDLPDERTFHKSKVVSCEFEEIKLRRFNIDIETMDSVDVVNAGAPIVSISLYDNFTDTYYLFKYDDCDNKKIVGMLRDKAWLDSNINNENGIDIVANKIKIFEAQDEYRMFLTLKQFMYKNMPDIIEGWNVKDFDIPYLERRLLRLKVSLGFGTIQIFDLMNSFEALWKTKHGELDSKSLENCSTLTLGYGKIKRKTTITSLYENDKELLYAYNIWDVVTCNRVNENSKIINFYVGLAIESGAFLHDTMMFSRLIDTYVLFHCHKTGYGMLPSINRRTLTDNLKGGLVLDPQKGIFKNVVAIDLTQEYPSIIRTLNISPDTKIKDETILGNLKECIRLKKNTHENVCLHDYFRTPLDHFYTKERRGVLPTILDYLAEQRHEMKRQMVKYPVGSQDYESFNRRQTLFKYFMNAFIGVLGMRKAGFRLRDAECFNDVTKIGRDHTRLIDTRINELGLFMVYGDTDSRYIKSNFDDPVDAINQAKDLCKELNEKFGEWSKKEFNADKSYFDIKFEGCMTSYFQTYHIVNGEKKGKKRYAYILYESPNKVEIKGFEVKRRSASPLTRALQEVVLTDICNFVDIQKIRETILKSLDDFRNGNHDKTMGIPTGLHKKFDTVNSPHYKAAIYSNMYLGYNFKPGDVIKWYYGYDSEHPETEVFGIGMDDTPSKTARIDYNKMCNRVVEKPLVHIIEALGYKWDEFLFFGDMIKQQKLGW